jgi:hypothetical protein
MEEGAKQYEMFQIAHLIEFRERARNKCLYTLALFALTVISYLDYLILGQLPKMEHVFVLCMMFYV